MWYLAGAYVGALGKLRCSKVYIMPAGTPSLDFDISIHIAAVMTETLASTMDCLALEMRNSSSLQLDEPQSGLSRSILPTILAGGWHLSAWQYIVLFLVGAVVYDQGSDHHDPNRKGSVDCTT